MTKDKQSDERPDRSVSAVQLLREYRSAREQSVDLEEFSRNTVRAVFAKAETVLAAEGF